MYFDAYHYVEDKYDYTGYFDYIKSIKRGIFLDTAPLYILVVGHYDSVHGTRLISKFQSKSLGKQRNYEVYDYHYLLAFLNSIGLGKDYNLYITPHIFTEFIKHLWEIDQSNFKNILETIFKNKWYIREKNPSYDCFINHIDFMRKRLEIGDISLTIVCNSESCLEKPIKTILTDDEPFQRIADKEYGFIVIYYNDIRNGTVSFKKNQQKIPEILLKEPPVNMENSSKR
ncbi:hypothetical protein HZC30_06795 [Candidatus Woesearchaeota archaeon]|nr:hypothetical protein [Candidatus Woesearchaeota archaeon]